MIYLASAPDRALKSLRFYVSVRIRPLEKRFRLFLLRCMYLMLAGLAVLRLEGY